MKNLIRIFEVEDPVPADREILKYMSIYYQERGIRVRRGSEDGLLYLEREKTGEGKE